MDIDKVIEGLKYCKKAACVSYKGHKCPYICSEYEEGCICEMQNDALEALIELQNAYSYLQKQFFEVQDKLLKEHEAVVPIPLSNRRYACGSCGNSLWVSGQRFCASCGKAVKWE